MAKRSLAGFGEVASINVSNNDNDNKLNEILNQEKAKPKLTGIYFDPEVLEVLDRLSNGKRGMKTKIVNEAVKEIFKNGGYM